MNRLSVRFLLLLVGLPSAAAGQFYAGALGGLATLSADARSVIKPGSAAFSLYKPENGASVSLLVGGHLTNYLSLQADYGWNRNDLTLSATSISPQGETLYQEARNSSEQSILGNLLLYFRNRRSWARPYLSVGTGHCEVPEQGSGHQRSNGKGGPSPTGVQLRGRRPARRCGNRYDHPRPVGLSLHFRRNNPG